MSAVWEIERDRHGLMFSGPLEVGECLRVVPLSEYEAVAAELDRFRGPLMAEAYAEIARLTAELEEIIGGPQTDAEYDERDGHA